MAEQKKKAAPKKEQLSNYMNTGKVNLFTESGRCHPSGIVALLPSQAKKYKGLELCKTK